MRHLPSGQPLQQRHAQHNQKQDDRDGGRIAAPVSYTHLDVYKRQHAPFQRMERETAESGSSGKTSFATAGDVPVIPVCKQFETGGGLFERFAPVQTVDHADAARVALALKGSHQPDAHNVLRCV